MTAWRPLEFFSQKLDPAQRKYSAFDRELFACYMGIRHFRFMPEGRRFTIYTDHKPLTYALRCVTDLWTVRECKHLAYIAKFTSNIKHVAGLENVVADTLSQPPGNVVSPQRPGVAALKPAAVKEPSGSAAAISVPPASH